MSIDPEATDIKFHPQLGSSVISVYAAVCVIWVQPIMGYVVRAAEVGKVNPALM